MSTEQASFGLAKADTDANFGALDHVVAFFLILAVLFVTILLGFRGCVPGVLDLAGLTIPTFKPFDIAIRPDLLGRVARILFPRFGVFEFLFLLRKAIFRSCQIRVRLVEIVICIADVLENPRLSPAAPSCS